MSVVTPITTAQSPTSELVHRLRRAFRTGKTQSLHWRENQLRRLKALLRENTDALAGVLKEDLGKSRFEGWLAELALVEKDIDYTLKNLRKWARPERVPTPMALQPAQSRIHRDPLGVVLVIAPWNYPIQLALLPLVGALAAGNCVVLKPSEVAAATSRILAHLLPQYMDTECVRVVEGGVPETTELLEQRWDHIFYTGNGKVGRIVMSAAAKHLTPVTLELGGKSPTIVDRSANLDVAARRIVWGKFFNAGQTCIAPDYILVHRDVEAELLDKLRAAVSRFFGDDPKNSRDYARIINERHFDRLARLLSSGEAVCGGETDRDEKYMAPTILKNVAPDAPVMEEEIFGPILPALAVDGIDEAIEFVLDREKPLALYVFADDRVAARRVLERTSSGGVCVNDVMMHFSVPELPFGGVGESGMGAYHGRHSFETFSHRRAVLNKSTRLDLPLRYPPYDDNKAKWLKRLM